MDRKAIPFKEHTKYKVGAITYDVAAHFDEDKGTLKSKVITLLINNTQKPHSNICNQPKQ